METIKAIIIDDEIEALSILKELLKSHSEIEIVAEANSVDDALIKILEFRPELIFLDIEMPNKNGFELIKLLNKNNIQISVIFVTAFNQFAIEAIKISAFDYILKPIDIIELSKCIKKYKLFKSDKTNNNYTKLLDEIDIKKKIKFNTRTGFTLIDPKTITHCIADSNYTTIYHSKNKKEIVSLTLSKVENILKNKIFYRIGRSCIINITFLDKVDRKQKKCILSSEKKQYIVNIPLKYIKKMEKII